MKLLNKLLVRVKRDKPEPKLLDDEQSAALAEAIEQAKLPPSPRAKGRVIKNTKRPEYNPLQKRGGRVTKAMPRELQKIKEAQEKVEDDE